MTDTATPTQLRDSMPFAALLGIELLEAGPEDGSLVAKVTQTQVFHYPRG